MIVIKVNPNPGYVLKKFDTDCNASLTTSYIHGTASYGYNY
jgi:hypothetical protein